MKRGRPLGSISSREFDALREDWDRRELDRHLDGLERDEARHEQDEREGDASESDFRW